MRRKPVKSTCVTSYGYDLRKQILEIEYAEGDIYDYFSVPPSTFGKFLRAASKGKFVNERIKSFPFKKIRRRASRFRKM